MMSTVYNFKKNGLSYFSSKEDDYHQIQVLSFKLNMKNLFLVFIILSVVACDPADKNATEVQHLEPMTSILR